MSEHLSLSDIQDYVDRKIEPDGLLAADDHLAECEECFASVADLRSRQPLTADTHGDLFSADDMDAHLTYEQLTAYVDGDIGEVDREIAAVHMAVCHECAEQIDELRHVRATLELETGPAAVPDVPAVRSSSLRLWDSIATGAFLRIAAPAFAVLLLGVIVLSVWLLNRTQTNDIVAVVEPPAVNIDGGNINSTPDVPANANSGMPQSKISLADAGTRIGIDENGNLTGLNAPQFDARIKAALTTQNIEISPAARELRSQSGTLMGDGQPGAPFALTAPVGRVVESDRPQLSWRPLAGAESYVVTIYDANFNKVAASPSLKQPSWMPDTRLKRGTVYQWQVTAIKDGQEVRSPVRPAPDARFKVIDAAAANDIAAAKRIHGNSHLLLGIVYANAGLLDEAEREFQALLVQNPRSEVARRLLNKVKAAR